MQPIDSCESCGTQSFQLNSMPCFNLEALRGDSNGPDWRQAPGLGPFHGPDQAAQRRVPVLAVNRTGDG